MQGRGPRSLRSGLRPDPARQEQNAETARDHSEPFAGHLEGNLRMPGAACGGGSLTIAENRRQFIRGLSPIHSEFIAVCLNVAVGESSGRSM